MLQHKKRTLIIKTLNHLLKKANQVINFSKALLIFIDIEINTKKI